MRLDYAVIAITTAAAAGGGWWIGRAGMGWYCRLRLPEWTPGGRVIGFVWAILYPMAALSAVLALSTAAPGRYAMIGALYGVNAFLNLAWTYLFFRRRQIGSAALDALLVAVSIAVIQWNVYSASPWAALLLAPYLVWTLFAAWLTYAIFGLN